MVTRDQQGLAVRHKDGKEQADVQADVQLAISIINGN
jgi:hypothetical protein